MKLPLLRHHHFLTASFPYLHCFNWLFSEDLSALLLHKKKMFEMLFIFSNIFIISFLLYQILLLLL